MSLGFGYRRNTVPRVHLPIHTVAWRDDYDDDGGGNDDDNHVDDDDEEEEADSDDEMIKRRIAGVQSNWQLQRIKWQI